MISLNLFSNDAEYILGALDLDSSDGEDTEWTIDDFIAACNKWKEGQEEQEGQIGHDTGNVLKLLAIATLGKKMGATHIVAF